MDPAFNSCIAITPGWDVSTAKDTQVLSSFPLKKNQSTDY